MAFILLILVIFLFSRKNIQTVMENTGLLDVLRTRIGLDESQSGDSNQNSLDTERVSEDDAILRDETNEQQAIIIEQTDQSDDEDQENDTEQVQEQDGDEETTTQEGNQEGESQRPIQLRAASLYFIRVENDGSIHLKQIQRQLRNSDTPLTDTLEALLQGLTAPELNDGLLNLIPEDTLLLSATVNNRVAYLNFNESFRFNSLGAEGLLAQLQQIVYTATEFSSVDRVQFLIEGKQVNYLSGDGVFIGQPLGRSSFRQ